MLQAGPDLTPDRASPTIDCPRPTLLVKEAINKTLYINYKLTKHLGTEEERPQGLGILMWKKIVIRTYINTHKNSNNCVSFQNIKQTHFILT